MSQDFKLKFDEYKNNDPSEKKDRDNSDQSPSGSNIRNLAFVWPDGKMQFFNYSYIITCILNDKNIEIEFSSHNVKISGQKLNQLFNMIMNQSIRVITIYEERYGELYESEKFHVQDVEINANK